MGYGCYFYKQIIHFLVCRFLQCGMLKKVFSAAGVHVWRAIAFLNETKLV